MRDGVRATLIGAAAAVMLLAADANNILSACSVRWTSSYGVP